MKAETEKDKYLLHNKQCLILSDQFVEKLKIPLWLIKNNIYRIKVSFSA